jgi:hypothetical protein
MEQLREIIGRIQPNALKKSVKQESQIKNKKLTSKDQDDCVYTMEGVGETLQVFENRLNITPKGVLGFMTKGLKGTKTIPFASIVAVQFKKSGLTAGYIQFTIPGGVESRGGVLDSALDENTFMFAGQNDLALEIKHYIENRVEEIRNPPQSGSGSNLSDEIAKLAEMKQKGILTEEEFLAAKKRILG